MRRTRTRSRVRGGFENRIGRSDTEESKVIGDIVDEHASLVGDPIRNLAPDQIRVPEDMVEGFVRVSICDGEDIRKESMVAKVGADGRVIDKSLDIESFEVRAVSDSREHQDLGGIDGSCGNNNFSSCGNNDW